MNPVNQPDPYYSISTSPVLCAHARPTLRMGCALLATAARRVHSVSRFRLLAPLQPFPQFQRAGFSGFTLTPLTPAARPPTATHPDVTNGIAITY